VDKKEKIKKEIEDIKERLERCFEKRMLTDDPEKEIRLEKLEEKLEEKLTAKEQELYQLSHSRDNKRRSAMAMEDSLCSIDFAQAKAIIRSSIESLGKTEGGSAVFLMENCSDYEGRLLFSSLRKSLDLGNGYFREWPVEFSLIQPASKMAFFKILGGYLKIEVQEYDNSESDGTLLEVTTDVLNKLSSLLRSGTTILIPIRNWKSLDRSYQAEFLQWFINQFWQSLQQSLTEVLRDYSPRIVLIIMVDEVMAQPCQDLDCFYNGPAVGNADKILRLPLTDWFQNDVRQWLTSYAPNLTKQQRNQLVQAIFNGKPSQSPYKIRQELEKEHDKSVF